MTSLEPEEDVQVLARPALSRIAELQQVLYQAGQTANESLRLHTFSIYLVEKKPNTQKRRRMDVRLLYRPVSPSSKYVQINWKRSGQFKNFTTRIIAFFREKRKGKHL